MREKLGWKSLVTFFIVMFVTTIGALLPVTYSHATLPVVEGKAIWPSNNHQHGAVYNLDGQWLLTTDQQENVLQQVPGVAWAHGSGKYSLSLFVEQPTEDFELYTINAGTNYSLLVNGIPVGASGVFAETAKESVSSAATRVHQFSLHPGWNSIEIWVSNYVHPRGGLWEHVKIGISPHLSRWHERWIAIDLILFGMLIMFVIMHLLLGFYTKNRSYFLWFAMGAFSAAIGGLLRNQFALFSLIPELPYLVVKKAQIATLLLAGGWFVSAFSYQYESKTALQRIRIFRYFSEITALLAIIIPYRLSYPLALVFFIAMAIALVMLVFDRTQRMFLYTAETSCGWELAKLIGDAVLLYGLIHDFINIVFATYEIQVLPYAIGIYVGLYSLVLSSDFFRAMQRNEIAKVQIIESWEKARKQLASDLHDGVIQLTHGLSYMAQGALQKGIYDEQLLGKMQETAHHISTDLRYTIDSLNPTRIAAGGFSAAIETLALRIHDTYHISVLTDIQLSDEKLLQPMYNNLYYIISEAVSNAVRHAHPTTIHISFNAQEDDLVLIVDNDGAVDLEAVKLHQGHGLDIIRYRAESLGGKATIQMREPQTLSLEVRIKRSQL
jgi:signal transduction histidine kinase